MKRQSRWVLLVVFVWLYLAGGGVPWAQYQTQPTPGMSPFYDDRPLSPSSLPIKGPKEILYKGPLTGDIKVSWRRIGDYDWRYHLVNQSERFVSGVHLVVPDGVYDSRVEPKAPAGWVAYRNRGQGTYSHDWVLSWFSTQDKVLLSPRRQMEIGLVSGAPMLYQKFVGRTVFSSSPADQLILPWDGDFLPTLFGSTQQKSELSGVVYPSLALREPKEPERLIPDLQGASVTIYGTNHHSGDVFNMSVRSERAQVGLVEKGSLLLPDVPLFDDMIVARAERLPLIPGDVANIRLRAFSISFGKKPPPQRFTEYEVKYHFAPASQRANMDEYRKVLERAARLTPQLVTKVGQDYPAIVTQWGLWRKERILEGKPLELRDLERDLALYFVWSGQVPGSRYGLSTGPMPVRLYLNPIEVRDLARQVWGETDKLIYEVPLPERIP